MELMIKKNQGGTLKAGVHGGLNYLCSCLTLGKMLNPLPLTPHIMLMDVTTAPTHNVVVRIEGDGPFRISRTVPGAWSRRSKEVRCHSYHQQFQHSSCPFCLASFPNSPSARLSYHDRMVLFSTLPPSTAGNSWLHSPDVDVGPARADSWKEGKEVWT